MLLQKYVSVFVLVHAKYDFLCLFLSSSLNNNLVCQLDLNTQDMR